MRDYSQNGEQAVIFEIIHRLGIGPASKLLVTDIGANDGETLSNSRALILQGANAQLIEPSPSALEKLHALYDGNDNVKIFPYAVSNESGEVSFYESGEHAKNLYGENIALLSTLVKSESKKWKAETFTERKVMAKKWNDLGIPPGDILLIDAEGKDWEILRQIDLSGVSILCIEYNSVNLLRTVIHGYSRGVYGMDRVFDNGTNLIYSRW
jgi:FkbM family methyltransferase